MRRTTSVLLCLSALLTASALAAPAAGAAPRADRPAVAVPAGWEVVDGAELAATSGKSEPGQDRSVLADGSPSATAEEELIAMQSVRNERFVAAEVSRPAPDTGALRARSADIGGWESFAFEWDETTESYALRSTANGLYVAVEKNFTGDSRYLLRARSATAGGWERFDLYHHEELDRWALRSRLNGLFVAMEYGYTGPLQYALRARSADIGGSWEEFRFYGLEI